MLGLSVRVVAAELLGEEFGEGAVDGIVAVGAKIGEDAIGDGGRVGGEFGLEDVGALERGSSVVGTADASIAVAMVLSARTADSSLRSE